MSRRAFSTAFAAVALAALLLASPASAKRNIQLGFSDDPLADNLLFGPDTATNQLWAGRIANAGAQIVRLNAYWRRIAIGVPADPTNPDDPAYYFEELDRAVRAADAAGLEPLLTALSAPDYAEAPGRPADVRPGTWKPKPSEFERFAIALATRYSGSHPDPIFAGTLPRVTLYEGWNEPNLNLYINPQRKRGRNTSPQIYRGLLNGFYDGIKAVGAENVVLAAGTSPFGDPTGARRIPPLEFWRDVLCLRNRKKLKFARAKCPPASERAHFDRFTHNSINSPGDGPSQAALNADNATAADMHLFVDTIRAAEQYGSVQPEGLRRDVWSTELWFESSPPENRKRAASLKGQARYIAEVLYILWKQRITAGIFLQIRDSPYDPSTPAVVGLQSGVYFEDGSQKPSLQAARFPFVADRKSRRKVLIWGKAPETGTLVVQQRKTGWRRVARFRVQRGQVFKKNVKVSGRAKLRGELRGTKTISWRVKSR